MMPSSIVLKGETESGKLEFEFLMAEIKVGIYARGKFVELVDNDGGNFDGGNVHGLGPF
jgi:hypothetical protein